MIDTGYRSSCVPIPVHRSSNIEDEIERSKHETQLRLILSIVTVLGQAAWDQIDGVNIEIGVLGCRIECQILSGDFQFGHGICNANFLGPGALCLWLHEPVASAVSTFSRTS